ncbi:uncharacterized protein LOC132697139 [Cylas formicarius]|uniref:uncharacterized protein LOC132697139 n=1 Tax=Cylas formicarius TaxID=197179 RepID=UPI002958DA7D|nr:uncharacterized protein LOC132697139 [Cylas formicarius]
MSRRMRLEEERLQLLKEELQEEEDKIKLMQEKIFAPLVWRRLGSGIKIQDLKSNYYEDAVAIILKYFINEDVLFRNTKIADDPSSQESFGRRIMYKLKDSTSIIAIDEGHENKVTGILLLNVVNKSDFARIYSRTMLVEGNAYKSISEFMNFVNRKVDVFEECQHDTYLQFYLLCIVPEYRGQGLGYHLMRAGMDVARHLKIPTVMGIFNSYSMQKLATRVGIDRTLYEVEYANWVDPLGELVFCDPGPGNYTCAMMVGTVPLTAQDTTCK